MKLPTFLVFTLLFHAVPLFSQHVTISRSPHGTTAILKVEEHVSGMAPVSFPSDVDLLTDELDVPEHRMPFNWLLKFSRAGKVFKDVSFADPENGYLVTELGAVYKTTKGGDNWTTALDLGFPYYWYGVETLTPDTVVIAGFNNQDSIHHGAVRWSFDGGSTWEPEIVLAIPGGVGWLDRVHFFSPDTGIVMASFSGGVHYTTTGGKDSSTWDYTQTNQDLAWFAGNIDAQASGRVFATGIHFAQSSDFGVSWVSMNSADPVFDGGVDFLDENNELGWTGGGQISAPVEGWVHRTTDGGQTWSPRLLSAPYPIRAVRFFNDTLGLAVGGNVYEEAGGMYSTSDGGVSWSLDLNTAAEMFAVEAIRVSDDSVDVWCAGSTGGGTGFIGRLYKSRIYLPSGITSVNLDEPAITDGFELYNNYPNPFNGTTAISFSVPQSGTRSRPDGDRDGQLSAVSVIRLSILNTLGQEVGVLVNGETSTGRHVVTFKAPELASGVYFARLIAGGFTVTRKMILLK